MKRSAPRGKLGRRQFAGSATAAVGVSLLATPSLGLASGPLLESGEHVGPIALPPGAARTPGISVDQRAKKPTFLPAENAGLAAQAVADVLFWTDLMMEHALFLTLLMPGDRLRTPRAEARQLQIRFAQLFLYARDNVWQDGGLSPLLSTTRSSVQQIIAFKRRVQEEQARGVLRSLVWPSFAEHVAHEAERFARRLDQLAGGDAALQLDEIGSFWMEIMAEHFGFIAHLLDPKERELVAKAMARSEELDRARAQPADRARLTTVAEEVIDFKTAAEQGIETGQIKSIIDPALADHVLREAVKFSDEIKRAR